MALPAIVLPTYNEIENIAALVASILNLNCGAQIIVVDDNSPDGTGELADELARRHPEVSVVHRLGKLGLGTAYMAGFQAAFARDADPILTMDADFSHDPRYIPAMLEGSQSHDLVIGSRYVPGGGVKDWGPERRLLSWGANTTARLLLGLQAHDCTAGFRCYRRRTLAALDLERIRANGYSYLIEMLYYCQAAGFQIGEVPIIFADRRLGQSKISSHEIRRAMNTVLRLAAGRRPWRQIEVQTKPDPRLGKEGKL